MQKLRKLGKIIDDLFIRQRSGKPLKKLLVFVIGNGIDPVNNIINDRILRSQVGKRSTTARSFEAFKWRHFEYARYYTSTSLPSFAHCCIYKLVEAGLCHDVITTNYDMFLDTLWQRSPQLRVQQNPILETDEYSWEGYFSSKRSGIRYPRYWKIHGSLSHICFGGWNGGPQHIHRLPRFAVSANDDSLAKKYRIRTQAPYMGFEMACYPRTRCANHADLTGRFRPYIDWTWKNDRIRFQREIEAAKAVFRYPERIAAVLLIGFSGYYNNDNPNDPWNEELVPEIRNLRMNGFQNVYMAVHSAQVKRMNRHPYGLMRELATEKQCWPYQIAGNFMADLLKDFSCRFPYDYAEAEYAKWKRCWYLPQGESSHV